MRSCNFALIFWPKSEMLPESGAVMLTIIRIVVVFPAPFGPSSPNTRPARTVRLSSLTAVNSPKLLLTLSSFTVISFDDICSNAEGDLDQERPRTPKALANLSPGFERSEEPWDLTIKIRQTLKGFLS